LIIGVDLDGVLTTVGLYNTDTKLPWWCGLWLIFVPSNKKMACWLRMLYGKGNQIYIISARPRELEFITKVWLKIHRMPFNQIFFLGTGPMVSVSKLEVLKQVEADIYLDDNLKTVDFLNKNGVKAYFPSLLFSS